MKTPIKKTYICKDVTSYNINFNTDPSYKPEVGDVAVFEIIKLGKHKSMQNDEKRNATILPGDRIMAAFGTRYATAQFEGYVPEDCNRELHILGAGGTVGVIESMHEKFVAVGPTTLKFIGSVIDGKEQLVNTKTFYHRRLTSFSGMAAKATKIILSVGSSMDSGKTTSAAFLVRGLRNAGHAVAFIKLTGTVYTRDCDLNFDLGANMTADFGDFGFPSTYMCTKNELLNLYESLLKKVMIVKPDYVVMEIADGLYQRETKMLLRSQKFMSTIYAVLFSAGDSLAAINGVRVLQRWGIKPFAISGLLTASPLLIKEVKENCSLPVYTIDDLSRRTEEITGRNISALNSSNRKLKKAS
jgi:hypothetical protein